MHIEHLRELLVLSQTRNFTKAAAECHISQSALSKHVKGLEEAFGVDLLDRSGSSPRFTKAGWSLVHDARILLSDYDTAVSHIESIKNEQSRIVRFGYFYPSARWLLRGLHTWVKRNKPAVEILPVSMETRELAKALEERRVEAIIVPEFDEKLSAECDSMLLKEEHMLLAVGKQHPLAKYDEVKLVDLAGEDMFVPSPDIWPAVVKHCDELLGGLPAYRNGRVLEDTDTLFEAVANGMGIALVLDHNRSNYGDRVRFIKLEEEEESGFHIGMYLMWLKGYEETHAGAKNIALLRRAFKAIAK